MIIREIRLQNFRQYKNAILDLRCDISNGKNVVIINGEGGAGKTTFTQAFRWCLYGVTTFRDSELLNADVIEKLSMNNTTFVSVSMRITNKGHDYVITRTLNYTMTAKGPKANETSSVEVKEESGDRRTLGKHEADIMIRNLIPKQLAPYFFFDGERMQHMVEELLQGKSEDIGNVVRGLVGLSSLESLMRHLKNSRNTTLLKKIEKQIDVCGNAEMSQLSASIEKTQTEIEDILKKIGDEEDKLEVDNREERNVEIELATYSDIEQLQKQWEINVQNKEEYERQKVHKQNMFVKNFKANFSHYALLPLLHRAKGMLKEDDLADKGVPDICNTTLDFLIKRGTCICGKNLNEHPECLLEIQKLYEYVPPKSAGTMIREMIDIINSETAKTDTFYDNMTEYMYAIDDLAEKSDIEEQKNQLIDQDILKHGDEIKKLKETQLVLLAKIKEHKRLINELNQQLGEKRTTLEKDQAERERMISANEASRRWTLYRAYVEAIYEQIVTVYKEQEIELKNVFETNINNIFENIYDDGLRIQVNDRYRIKVEGDLEHSTSQNYSIVFAFIATTLKMAKERKPDKLSAIDYPEDYPLVMDAPLSAFDKKRIKNICGVLPDIAEQIIIFIKDTDGDIAEEHLSHKIAKKYQIIMNTYTDSTIREVR